MHVRHLKVLGSSLLALVGIMAVSASTAQAEWELVGGTNDGGGQLLLNSLEATVSLGEILIPSLGAKIHCSEGKATAAFSTNGGMKALTGESTITFKNCYLLEFPFECIVRSSGMAEGTIRISGSGEATMPLFSNEVALNMSSENFSEIKFEGPLCPFDEISGKLNGSIKLAMPNPTTAAATQAATLDDVALKYGAEKAVLHAGNGKETETKPISATMKKVFGGNWAIKLVGAL